MLPREETVKYHCDKPPLGVPFLVACGWIALWWSAVPLCAATRVPLRLVERAGVARTGEGVTAGIPLPQGAWDDVEHVRLLRNGREIPAQFRAAGLWRPGTSIRWLLVDFRADLEPNGVQHHVLEYGASVSRGAAPSDVIDMREDGGGYAVSTGTATFRISKRTFNLFEEVRLGDGTVVLAEPQSADGTRGAFVRGVRPTVTRAIPDPANQGRSHLIYVQVSNTARLEDCTLRFSSDRDYEVIGAKSGPLGRGVYLQDFVSTDGALSIPQDAWLRYAYPKQGDAYTFRTLPDRSGFTAEGVFETRVLERGPLRSVICVRGPFGPATAPVLEYTARYHFYAGSGQVKLVLTLENNDHGGRTSTGNARNADIGGINCVFFDEMGLQLSPALGRAPRVCLGGGADRPPVVGRPEDGLELYQDSGGGEYWDRYRDPKLHPRPNSYVSFRGYRIRRGGVPVDRGDRALGWVDVSGVDGGVTVGIRHFWQNFPKSLAVEKDGRIRIGLFPGRYAGDFPLRSGEHKTHEILFLFHPARPGKEGNKAAVAAFSRPLRLEPSPEWFARTKALGRLHPVDVEDYRDYEIRNYSTIGVAAGDVRPQTSLPIRLEECQFFGWMDYGDVPIDFEAPSGQWGMKYDMDYHMAQQYARTLHPQWWGLFEAAAKHTRDVDIHHQPHYPGLHFVKGGVWAHSLHAEPGHKNPHRNHNHFTKDLCFGARGAAALHYMTGDWKAYDACLEIAENALAEYMSPQADPGDGQAHNRMGWRGDACTLNRLLEGYLLSGEERFLERARWQIKSCAFDARPPRHEPISLWSSLFYMMALARYVDMFPDDEAAKSYLLAHLETLRKAADPGNGILYTITPRPDGSVVGQGTCSHYNVMAADALVIGYLLTGDRKYHDAARRCFAYGVKNACWKGGPPTYFHVHSANGAMHGNIFMAVDASLRAKQRP
jgi:hypothetical protein